MTPVHTPQRRPSWRGVLAGLLMGIVTAMAMAAIALILSSFLPFDLQGTSIAAGIYAALTALLSAFVAGYFAVKCSAPEALFGDGTDIDPKDASLTGMLTAAAIVLASTLFAINGATSILSTATNAVGSTVSTVTQATAGVASAGAGVVGAAAGGVAQNVDMQQMQQQAEQVYNQVTGEISRNDVEQWVAKNTDGLTQEQINAATDVVQRKANQTKAEAMSLDFTDLDTWKNINTIAKNRLAGIEQDLTGDELINELEQEGLSEAQAQQVRTEVLASFNEYKAESEQYVAQAKQTADQAMLKADQALQQAEDVARKAALYSGLFWLISTLLTFAASIFGAKKAAANYRLQRPIVTYGDNVR